MSVAWVAVEARLAQIGRTYALEGTIVDGVLALAEHLARLEVVVQSLLVDGRSLVLIAAGVDILGGSQLATWIPFLGGKTILCLAYIVGIRFHRVVGLLWVAVLIGAAVH